MGGYNQIFGGSAVYPSNQTYAAIDLVNDLVLAWPIESVSSETIVADLMDFTTETPGGWNVTLPDATGGSNGITMIVSNLSNLYSFNVQNITANLVVTVAPGTVWLIYLTDNTTSAGVWTAFQYGAQAGSVNVAAIAGAGLLAIGSSLNQSMPVTAKSSNYTIVTDDRASVVLWTGAGGTLTLPSAAAAASNWFINIRNSGTGDVVVSPPSGTIDGAVSKTFTQGVSSAVVFTDGTNYYTLGYGSAATVGGFDYTTINAAGSDGVNGVVTLAGGQLNRISYKVFGILTGTRTIVVPTTVQQYWINNQTTSSGGPWTLTIKTLTGGGQTISQPGQAIVYCDGTDVQPSTSGITLPVPIASGGTGATTAAAALTSLGGTATGVSLFTSSSAAIARGFLGAGTVGGNVFQAATASTALTAMAGGTLTGALTITGLFTANAGLSTAGAITGASVRVLSNTVPVAGIYSQAANILSFASNTTLAGYFDTSQNLNLIHPLAVTQGGTGATTVAAAATALGDMTAVANTLAQRNAGADILARTFNMSLAVDNATAVDNVMFNANADGYIRRTSLAHFSSLITPDSLSTATGGAGSYSARAYGRITNNGVATVKKLLNCTVSWVSTGLYTVTFLTNMPDVNYTVVFGTQQVGGNNGIQAMIAQGTTPALNLFQFEVTNLVSRGDYGGTVTFAVYD